MAEINRFSALVAGVPLSRGSPVHIEEEELAFCELSGHEVEAIHTPPGAFQRVHEFMHAKYSDENEMRVKYAGCDFLVLQLAEDCRLHCNFWPWGWNDTPEIIMDNTKSWLRKELTALNKAIDKGEKISDFTEFAVRMRQLAIRRGAHTERYRTLWRKVGFRNRAFGELAKKLLDMFESGQEAQAAAIIQMTFFGAPKAPPRRLPDDEEPGEAHGEKIPPYETTVRQPEMEIIELEHSVRIPQAKVGFRRATMGPRLHLPSLRKTVLPQRLFMKRYPQRPDGTILIDASGSMGDFSVVQKWIAAAPFGTVAYYAGHGNKGWLYIAARNGLMASEFTKPPGVNNTVDGPAIDWLLQQKHPLVMVTDEGFCGAYDSFAQIARLQVLKQRGVIKVVDYAQGH